MDNENVVIIYNLLVGSDSRLSFQKVRYAVAMLTKEEVVEGIQKYETLGEVLKYAKGINEHLFDDIDLKQFKYDVNHDLTVGMLGKVFNLDAISVDAYYQENFPVNEVAIKLGRMIQEKPEEYLEKLFPPME